MTLAAHSVSTRIGFTSAWATWGAMLLKRLGVFPALRGDCHRSTRHALLKSAGTRRATPGRRRRAPPEVESRGDARCSSAGQVGGGTRKRAPGPRRGTAVSSKGADRANLILDSAIFCWPLKVPEPWRCGGSRPRSASQWVICGTTSPLAAS